MMVGPSHTAVNCAMSDMDESNRKDCLWHQRQMIRTSNPMVVVVNGGHVIRHEVHLYTPNIFIKRLSYVVASGIYSIIYYSI